LSSYKDHCFRVCIVARWRSGVLRAIKSNVLDPLLLRRDSDTVKMDCACRQFAMGLIRCGGTSPL
jgi:hypothetical protein